MIILNNIHKRYKLESGKINHVLQGVTVSIPRSSSIGLIGRNGVGKSTLLRIIGGLDLPTSGTIDTRCRISWPIGFIGGLQGSLSGRQNAKFICRIHAHDGELYDRLAYIQDFSELGSAFDDPVKTYSSGMRARLNFAISIAFNFDVYLADEVTAVGDAAFRKKALAAFRNLAGKAGIIMVSHSDATLREFCKSGIWLHEGQAIWFDDIRDALKAYNGSLAA